MFTTPPANPNILSPALPVKRGLSYSLNEDGYALDLPTNNQAQVSNDFWRTRGYIGFTALGVFIPLSESPMRINADKTSLNLPNTRPERIKGTNALSIQKADANNILSVGSLGNHNVVDQNTPYPRIGKVLQEPIATTDGTSITTPEDGGLAIANLVNFAGQGFTINNTLKVEITTNDPTMPKMTIPEFDESLGDNNPDVVWCMTAESYLTGIYIMSRIAFTNVLFNLFMTRASE
jgi:hypothetical protein